VSSPAVTKFDEAIVSGGLEVLLAEDITVQRCIDAGEGAPHHASATFRRSFEVAPRTRAAARTIFVLVMIFEPQTLKLDISNRAFVVNG
jgi:hypothetical protein